MTDTLTEPVVEFRSGDEYQVAEVNFPKRLVTVVAMPYESPAAIYAPGRTFTEVVSRGAFTGIEKRAGKIRANRDHSWQKVVGKLVALHPSRKEGLVTEVRMFTTPDGEETLRLCDEGGLDASAGFTLLCRDDGRVWDDAEVWEQNRSVRRLNRLRLDHLAFVPNPAYQDATVLDVRRAQEPAGGEHTSVSMPNRDRLRIEALRAEKALLDARWLRP
jgi:HK97 family phage prohead protease